MSQARKLATGRLDTAISGAPFGVRPVSSRDRSVLRPAADVPHHARKGQLRELRAIATTFSRSRLSPLQLCSAILRERVADPKVRAFFGSLPEDEKHYWVASLFTLLMPPARRRKLAAYFTPPHLVSRAIDLLVDSGVVLGSSSILDPASGGAAFLVPLAARIAHRGRRTGDSPEKILRTIEASLAGIEIDPDLSALSLMLVSDLLRPELNSAKRAINLSITTANTLALEAPTQLHDAIIGNPPYGRVFRPTQKLRKQFAGVISQGYVNLYSLFIEQSIRFVRPGGLICLVVPMSFIGGPHFSALRKRILQSTHVLSLDPIDKRSDVFLDVLYDVCILRLRKSDGTTHLASPSSHLLCLDEPPRMLGEIDLPKVPSERMWGIPDGGFDGEVFGRQTATLADYGYITKTGYFVWNREQHRYRTGFKPGPKEVPLFWAHNVQGNGLCFPKNGTGESKKIGLVTINDDSQAIIRTDAVILQRTSNRRQKRRIIASIVRQDRVPGNRGFVGENHTILILPDKNKKQTISIAKLCRLLNTAAVDSRFRRISGSVSVSTKALRELPLPLASSVGSCFTSTATDEVAAVAAYSLSESKLSPALSADRSRKP